MNALDYTQPPTTRHGRISTALAAGARALMYGLASVVDTICEICTRWEADEQALSFEQRLQRTGRVRYR